MEPGTGKTGTVKLRRLAVTEIMEEMEELRRRLVELAAAREALENRVADLEAKVFLHATYRCAR
jgi:uncharacterized protein YlxW (UPF0749 family)